jgi:hypothetical protein
MVVAELDVRVPVMREDDATLGLPRSCGTLVEIPDQHHHCTYGGRSSIGRTLSCDLRKWRIVAARSPQAN